MKLFDFIFEKTRTDRFSSLQKAIMEGGHDMSEYRYQFIKEVKSSSKNTESQHG